MQQEYEMLLKDDFAKTLLLPSDIPSSPNALLLRKWYKLEIERVNNAWDNAEEKYNIHSTCIKGCAHCCKQLIVISSVELLMIAHAVNNFTFEEKGLLKQRVVKVCDVLSENEISINSPVHTRSLKSQQELQDKYFKLQLNCPFLSDENECLIYDIRPSLCWNYRNYGAASACANSWNVPTTLRYDYLEQRVSERLYVAKKPDKRGLMTLPFAIGEVL